jgi:Potassium-transporting ATPase A subunit/K+-transporting ATPase, c chain
VPVSPQGTPVTSPAPGQKYAKTADGSYVCDPNTIPERAIAYRSFNGLAANAPVPVDAVTASGSGLDPDISVQNALDQAPRVARARHQPASRVIAIVRLQGVLPGNPTRAPGMPPLLSFNTAVSFITGTNWQAYEGETQASSLADTAGLVVAQFTAAGVGLAVALAVVRGIAGKSRTIGNFWSDLTRSLVRVFVPMQAEHHGNHLLPHDETTVMLGDPRTSAGKVCAS